MSDALIIAAIVILGVLFGGDPDLMDAIIGWINSPECQS